MMYCVQAAFSPPTGALRRDSEENLLQETQNEATRESVNEEDSGWDTDLEIDGEIVIVHFNFKSFTCRICILRAPG